MNHWLMSVFLKYFIFICKKVFNSIKIWIRPEKKNRKKNSNGQLESDTFIARCTQGWAAFQILVFK